MPRFAANLTMLFTEVPFLDRFERAAAAGFGAVECLFPYEVTPRVIADELARHGLTQALFNLPPGDWAGGERGLACDPGRFDEVMRSVETALPWVRATGVGRVHLMAGLGDRSDPARREAFVRAAAAVADRLAGEGVDVLIEPINRRDMPGYFLDDFDFAAGMIADLGRPNLKLQFDVYHRQIIAGDVITALRRFLPIIGHVQIASVPARHEPGSGELADDLLFAELDRLGYTGFVGCEYRPAAGTEAGLGWFDRWRDGQR
ncbi:MAG: TIM barrel protein [Siculibacillus sp.]|nr:TIM barrel protein [Siculibacillus sp.]